MLFVKKLTQTARLPERAHEHDAGLDVFADETVTLPEYGRATIRTGIVVNLLYPWQVGLIWPRSGLAAKGISTDAGVIDSGYRGEVKIVMTNSTPHRYTIHQGDKIAQILIQKVFLDEVMEVQELEDSTRGANGFGSTG